MQHKLALPSLQGKACAGASYAPAGSRTRGTSMEGLYVAATLQVLMLPWLSSRQKEVMPLAPCASCMRVLTLWAGLGRAARPPLETKGKHKCTVCLKLQYVGQASLAQLAEHALRKRMVTGSIPVGGFCKCFDLA